MLNFLKRCQINLEEILQKFPVVLKIPFSSDRKRMSVILKMGETLRMMSKGYLYCKFPLKN